MPYILDGHNLIPKISGLSLADIDDEMQLVELLQEFCRRQRKRAEVYFDNAPAGQPRARKFGPVTARFVRQGTTADQAIKERLQRLGRSARNWTVVSSDQEVQDSARSVKARFIGSEAFAAMLRNRLEGAIQEGDERPEAPVDPEEVNNWLALFGETGEED